MAEDPRDLIRAAQSAELAKDAPGAVALLRRAAELYRAQGKHSRAEQIDRNVERLTSGGSSPGAHPGHPELVEGSASPEFPSPSESPGDGQRVRPRREFQRGAEPADPSQLAWCSFCCRPSTEVGRLVTGPTGSFICAACVDVAHGHLGDSSAAPRAPSPNALELERHLLPSQHEVLSELERAMHAGAQRILMMGAVGVGKSRVLEVLEERGLGRRPGSAPSALPVLVNEDFVSGVEGERRAAELSRSRFVLAGVGGLLYPRFRLRGPISVVLPTTAELAEATGGRLPMSLLESVDLILPLRPPTEAELRAVAANMLLSLEPPRKLSDALVGALALAALESGRGMHELCALVRRIPPGEWELGEEER